MSYTMDRLIDTIAPKTALTAKTPYDMRQFASHYNRTTLEQAMPGPGIHKWLNDAEEMRSKKDYEEFSYTINDMGFRDHYPDPKESNILAFFGCSFTFGEGLPSKKNFPFLLSHQTEMKMLNLGMPGTGAHRIYLTMLAASNIWNIDTAVVTLPNYARFHYVDSTGNFASILPPHPIEPAEIDKVRISILKTFSEPYLLAQARDAVQSIILLAKLKGIKLILGSWDMHTRYMINKCFGYETANYVPNIKLETARDNIHPGPKAAMYYKQDLMKRIREKRYV